MKNYMISIQPQYVEPILNKKKTLEIRTRIPKEWKDYFNGKGSKPTPSKWYIYCTKAKSNKERLWKVVDPLNEVKPFYAFDTFGSHTNIINGKVVAEFTLKQVEKIIYLTDRESVKKHGCWECKLEDKWKIENGLNKSQFNPEDYSNYYTEGSDDNYLIFYSKLTGTELHNYLKGRTSYALHIDNLVAYDNPKELSDFKKENKCHYADYEQGCCFETCTFFDLKDCDGKCSKITVAPQSWCYVEGE